MSTNGNVKIVPWDFAVAVVQAHQEKHDGLFVPLGQVRIPAKSATQSDFGRTLNPVISDTYRSVATLVI